MIWYYTIDSYWYKHPEELQLSSDVIICPTIDEIRKNLRDKKLFNVVSPEMPPEEFRSIFILIKVPNKYGIFTFAEKEYLESFPQEKRKAEEQKLMEKKSGLKMYKPNIPKENLIGMTSIYRYANEVKLIEDQKLKPKGVFLVGLPGTGKSFSAKIIASTLGWWLVEFNISKILEDKKPIFLLDSIFSYLEELSLQGESFVLWIDKIEDMFSDGSDNKKRVLERLFTILSNLRKPEGYKVNGIFWVTANNIRDILTKNPEFLRRGKFFDQLFFVDSPTEENAKKVFELYAKIYKLFSYGAKSRKGFTEDAVDFTNMIYHDLSKGAPDASRFSYVPAEIEQIVKELKKREYLNKDFLQKTGNAKKELIQQLYTRHIRQKIIPYVEKEGVNTINDEEYIEGLIKLHEKKLKDLNTLTTYLDLAAVISIIEPLSLSMREAISIIRSNEKFFTPAD